MEDSDLLARIAAIHERMNAAKLRSRLGQAVQLVAVTKGQPEAVLQQFLSIQAQSAAPVLFGENYVQEWQQKRTALAGSYEVHLIGPLQSNKASKAVALFDVIESVHSEKILVALAHEAEKIGKTQGIFLQVNISGDEAKAGFAAEEIQQAVTRAKSFRHLLLLGLMTITRDYAVAEAARADFRALRELRDSVDPALGLSMGMSGDFEVAIEEGATVVRIGTALFGPRVGARSG